MKSEKSGMLYSFFITQWYNPCKGDWTEQVKEDLNDLEIACSFDYIERKSTEAFKKIVKVKAKEYAIKILRSKQNRHRKMDNLNYSEIKMQSYLISDKINPAQKRTIFKFRTRMEQFGENFSAGTTPAICPLCKLHYDNQELSLMCPEIRNEIQVKGNMKDIYDDDIKENIIETITNIMELRKQKLGSK